MNIEKLNKLVEYLNESARMKREEAEQKDLAYARGLDVGYAAAFELAAKWLKEEMEEEQ